MENNPELGPKRAEKPRYKRFALSDYSVYLSPGLNSQDRTHRLFELLDSRVVLLYINISFPVALDSRYLTQSYG
jgi:hypothetical protein